MKRYRVLKSYDWERPYGGTIHGTPGEMALIPDEVFNAAPPGTFELLPGEDGWIDNLHKPKGAEGVDVFVVQVDEHPVEFVKGVAGSAGRVEIGRIPKAEVFAPAKKRGRLRK